VVSFNSLSLLTRCLEALTAEVLHDEMEILVVKDFAQLDAGAFDSLKNRYKDIRWVEASSGCTVPRMRSLGIGECHGDIVALLEDDCIVESGWRAAVLTAHLTHDVAIGGAVEPGPYKRSLDWGVYFSDYGRFMLPLPAGRVTALPGNNTSYKRAALRQLSPELAHEFAETFVHWSWERAQLPMRADQTVRVRNVHSWTILDVTLIPYHHGRSFAAQRMANRRLWRRLMRVGVTPIVPVVKVGRIIGQTLSRKRLIGPLVRALPWIVLFATSWSIGESIGYLRGAGESASVWR
jgi:hypothetical protein